jgi:hypothetical protein
MSVHEYPNTMIESSGSNKVQSFAPMQSYSAFPVPTALTTPTHQDKQISLNSPSPSPAKNLETVTAFLTQKAGQPLNEVEAEGLVSLIQKSTQSISPLLYLVDCR